jgi:Fur family ferric uptake transcriptional regulator
VDEIIEERQRSIGERAGFELSEHSLILYGNCKKTDCPYRKD